MPKGKLAIHSENILPIIKKWLYSDKEIFVRELVSNACDAIQKLRLLGQTKEASPFRIDLRIDKEKKTLTFSDNGIGMTADEVEKYIAQIAFSGAEDFVKAYEQQGGQDAFIGHFGLGFYSAYMVAHHVEIETLSYREDATPAHWTCDGSSEYELNEGARNERGTTITLHLDKESEDYLDESQIRALLQKYCSYLPYPIYLNDIHQNATDPLWIKAGTECSEEDYLSFFRHLYPAEPDPLFWVHLHVDYPFHLQGILYFPKITRELNLEKSPIRLFCNRVYVADNCKDIIPSYLHILKGVLDSPDIPLNVSRSTLQMDRTVRQLATHIAKKVADSLVTLYRNDRERFFRCWEDISPIIKLGAIEDDKFYERVKELLFWKTVEGEWVTVEQYLEKSPQGPLLYAEPSQTPTPIVEMYRTKQREILLSSSPIDPYLMQFLERKIAPSRFQRIDASLDDALVDKDREQTILDEEGKTQATRLAERIGSLLDMDEIVVEAKSLSSDALPGFLSIEESQRRMRDYLRSLNPSEGRDLKNLLKSTFVINTNHPLIAAVPAIQEKSPELAKKLVHEMYDLARLSQKEMEPDALHHFISRTQELLSDFAQQWTANPP